MMTFETAKKTIDYFISHPEIFNADKFSLDFMGGEPLIAIDLIDQIVDYFKVSTYKSNHPWFNTYRISITTNGTLIAGNSKFLEFCAKNRRRLNLSISVDGIKEAHDRNRVYYNGSGAFDDTIRGLLEVKNLIPSIGVKSTFSHESLKYLKESVIYLSTLGDLAEPYSNLVYEDSWQEGDDIIYENQLRELADYLVDNDLYDKMEVSFFEEFDTIGTPYTKNLTKKHWCSCGQQISISPEGDFYPCSRFHELSLFSEKKDRKIGNVDTGIDFDKLRPFRLLKLSNCSSQNCLECSVATGCGMCSGLSYDVSESNTIFCRTEFICKMHKARIRAKNYFVERLSRKNPAAVKKRHFYLSQLSAPRKVLNIMLASDSVNICGYDQITENDSVPKYMDLATLKKFTALARSENRFINLIYPVSSLNFADEEYFNFLNSIEAQHTKPYNNENLKFGVKDATVFVVPSGRKLPPDFTAPNIIILVQPESIPTLHDYVDDLLKRGIFRINLVNDLTQITSGFDIDVYRQQLEKIADLLYACYKNGHPRFVNVLSDILYSVEMNNCNAGHSHLTVGPDGRTSLCPALWRKNMTMPNDNLNIPESLFNITGFENATLCSKCDAFQCRRCIADNITRTDEYCVPGEFQCIISHIEREVSKNLQHKLREDLKINFPNVIKDINYVDPFRDNRVW